MKSEQFSLPEGVVEPISSVDEELINVEGRTYNQMTDDVWHFLVHDKGERTLKSFDLVDYFGLDPLSDQALLTTIKSALKTPDVGCYTHSANIVMA